MPPAARGLLIALALASACGSGNTADVVNSDVDAGSNADADVVPDLSDEVFAADRLLAIDIDLPASNWDSLRKQSRSFLDVLGSSCQETPPESPYTYFSATVTIDGERFENIGVRKKGFFGSLDETKPSLKVKFDEFVPGQLYSGLDRLTLNNNKSDPSHIKQCIGYDVFRAAGVASPRCNFARVTVNGDYLGIFTNVESVKKRFIRRHFASDAGNLYEGALSDFRPGWINTFQKKTNKNDPDRSDIEALVPLVESPAGAFVDELNERIDVDAFINFWATEVLLMHFDGYARNANNFFVYDDPATGKWQFIPWGIDAILHPENITLPWETVRAHDTVWVEGALARRLYNDPSTHDRFGLRLQELLDTVWDESYLVGEIDRMENLITPYLLRPEVDVSAGIETVRTTVNERRDYVETALAHPPEVDDVLREPWCLTTIGTFEVSDFATTFVSDIDNGVAGSAAFTITLHNETLAVSSPFSTAGYDAEGKAALRIIGVIDTDKLVVIHVSMDPSLFNAGSSVEIDWLQATGVVVDTRTPDSVDGLVGAGTISLSAASTVPGQVVSGSIAGGGIYEFPQ